MMAKSPIPGGVRCVLPVGFPQATLDLLRKPLRRLPLALLRATCSSLSHIFPRQFPVVLRTASGRFPTTLAEVSYCRYQCIFERRVADLCNVHALGKAFRQDVSRGG